MLKAAEKRPDMYENIKKAWKWIEDADAVLIAPATACRSQRDCIFSRTIRRLRNCLGI